MSTTTPSTNFFDLSLELRQQIYQELLPRSHYGDYSASLGDEKDSLKALCEADPRIATELRDEERICCVDLIFTVTATRWEPPSPTKYPNLQAVIVEYESYPKDGLPLRDHWDGCRCPDDEGRRQIRERYLKTMYHNLCRFVAWFQEANDQPISQLDADFEGYDTKNLCWYLVKYAYCTDTDIYDDGYDSYDEFDSVRKSYVTLATREKSPRERVSVVESLLAPLKKFPVVEDFFLCPFSDLTSAEDLRDMRLNPEFGDSYMYALEETWEEWLMGKRNVGWRKQFTRNLGKRNGP